MANTFIKVDIQGKPALINKTHILVAQFGNPSVTKIQLVNGDTIEVSYTPELFLEMQK